MGKKADKKRASDIMLKHRQKKLNTPGMYYHSLVKGLDEYTDAQLEFKRDLIKYGGRGPKSPILKASKKKRDAVLKKDIRVKTRAKPGTFPAPKGKLDMPDKS